MNEKVMFAETFMGRSR